MTEEKTRGNNYSNKYFLDLSKRSYNKSHIKKLKSSAGCTIEDSKTIWNEMKNYYQQLYTSQGQTSPDLLSAFLNSGPLPRLNDFSQSTPQC